MKTIELEKVELDELSFGELTGIDGGNSLLYYVSYDIGFLAGTVGKVAQRVVESIYYGSITQLIK